MVPQITERRACLPAVTTVSVMSRKEAKDHGEGGVVVGADMKVSCQHVALPAPGRTGSSMGGDVPPWPARSHHACIEHDERCCCQ